MITQCLTLFFVFLLILSSHLLTAILHAIFLTSIPFFVSILFLFSISSLANSVYFSSDFLLNVNVINLHLSWLFLNSFSSLMYHSPAFFFLHSSQYPHPIGTFFILLFF